MAPGVSHGTMFWKLFSLMPQALRKAVRCLMPMANQVEPYLLPLTEMLAANSAS